MSKSLKSVDRDTMSLFAQYGATASSSFVSNFVLWPIVFHEGDLSHIQLIKIEVLQHADLKLRLESAFNQMKFSRDNKH